MNFPSKVLFNDINHGYKAAVLRILTGKKHRQIKLTPALRKSTSVGVWVVTLNQLFIRGY